MASSLRHWARITAGFTRRSVSKSPAAKRVASKNNGALLHAELINVKVASVDSTGCAGGRLSVSGGSASHESLRRGGGGDPAERARPAAEPRGGGGQAALCWPRGRHTPHPPLSPCRINQRKNDNNAIAAPRT